MAAPAVDVMCTRKLLRHMRRLFLHYTHTHAVEEEGEKSEGWMHQDEQANPRMWREERRGAVHSTQFALGVSVTHPATLRNPSKSDAVFLVENGTESGLTITPTTGVAPVGGILSLTVSIGVHTRCAVQDTLLLSLPSTPPIFLPVISEALEPSIEAAAGADGGVKLQGE